MPISPRIPRFSLRSLYLAVGLVLAAGLLPARPAAAAGAAAAAAAAGAGAATDALHLHPQDGPHSDVRIRVDTDVLRWDIGMNLAFMDEIAPVGREREDALAEVEERVLREAVLEVLLRENRVVIDGTVVEPRVRGFDVARPDATLMPLFPRTGMRGLIRAHIVLEYPHDGDPDEIEMRWGNYPDDLLSQEIEPGSVSPQVLVALFQAEGIVSQIQFTRSAPTVTWRAMRQTLDERLDPVPAVSSWGRTMPAVLAFASGAGTRAGGGAAPASSAETRGAASRTEPVVPADASGRVSSAPSTAPAASDADRGGDFAANAARDALPPDSAAVPSTDRASIPPGTSRDASITTDRDRDRLVIPGLSAALILCALIVAIGAQWPGRVAAAAVAGRAVVVLLVGGALALVNTTPVALPIPSSIASNPDDGDPAARVASVTPGATSTPSSDARPDSRSAAADEVSAPDAVAAIAEPAADPPTARIDPTEPLVDAVADTVARTEPDPIPGDRSPAVPGPVSTEPLPPAVTMASSPAEAACVSVFAPLHTNLYRAFDYSEEGDIYDALERSVDGPLLEGLYARIYRGLLMADHDRAVARVTDVALLDASVEDPPSLDRAAPEDGFELVARWQVTGTVVHFGHSHVRIHEYAARYRVAPRGDTWRIVDQTMLESRRIPNPADPMDVGIPAELEL